MPRSIKKGRKSITIDTIPLIFTTHLACRISVAISAFMQFPAFFASCAAEVAPEFKLRIERAPEASRSLDVFVFSGEPPYLLDSYQQFPAGESPVYVVSGPGRKRVVALTSASGDIYSRAGINRYQDLSKEAFSLLDDSPGSPFSFGECFVEEGTSRSVSMSLNPLLSSIRVRSVSCDFSGSVYLSSHYHNDNLFLTNAVSESCPLGAEGGRPVSWVNYGYNATSHPFLEAEGLGDIGPERKYTNVVFYCYPNPGGRPPTRLVLEGTVGEKRCYYPINLPVPRSGTRLVLDISIHRMGTSDPDSEAVPGTYTLEYSTEPWYETDTVIQTV